MSNTTEIWNLGSLCRCCHTDGNFRNLSEPFRHGEDIEVYHIMLRETLNVEISLSLPGASYSICDICIARLRDAYHFKRQVSACEKNFAEYCKNEMVVNVGAVVKFEIEEANYNNANDDLTFYANEENFPIKADTESKYDEILAHSNKDSKAIKYSLDNNDEDSRVIGKDAYFNELKYENGNNMTNGNVKSEKNKKGATPKSKEHKISYDFSQEVLVKTNTGVLYSCKTCGGSYNDKKDLTQHITTNHTLGAVHTCDICQKTFRNKYSLSSHKATHEKSFQCPLCQKSLSSRCTLKHHMNTHTKFQIYKCNHCAKEFLYKATLKTHLKLHTREPKKFICHLCGHTFNDTTNMTIHIRSVHEKQRPFICDLCGRSYGFKKHLIVHICKHTGYKPYSCNECKASFYTGFDRNIHTCGDAKYVRTYKCKICYQIFTERNIFQSHVRTSHAGLRPHKCSYCEKDFTCKYSRNRHQMLHTDIKPYECKDCKMVFRQKEGLNRHVVRLHRDFNSNKNQCDVCGRTVLDLVQHKLNCHSKNSVVCDVCDKSYPCKKAMRRHKRLMHTKSDLEFRCDLCDKKFGQRFKLVRHQLKMHELAKSNKEESK